MAAANGRVGSGGGGAAAVKRDGGGGCGAGGEKQLNLIRHVPLALV